MLFQVFVLTNPFDRGSVFHVNFQVILKVLTDTRKVVDNFYIVIAQMFRGPYAG